MKNPTLSSSSPHTLPTPHGKTLVILNPHAGSGRAGRLWSRIEPLLWRELGEMVVAVTQNPADVAIHLDKARAAGLTNVIAIGGDGTNHVLVNALVALNRTDLTAPPMTFGSIPIGTGSDWARTFGIPLDPVKAVTWIRHARPTPIDIGQISTDSRHFHFLNIASTGISGEIARRVNRVKHRRPWTFYQKTVEALLRFRPPRMKVYLDDQLWYDDRAYVVTVANGRSFGHGMLIAPDATATDGLFDVVLIEKMGRLEAIRALSTVYTGAHVTRKDVHVRRARSVRVEGVDGRLPMELDGEQAEGNVVQYQVLPGLLPMLLGHA